MAVFSQVHRHKEEQIKEVKILLTDTHFSAFVKSRTTLGFTPIHGFLPMSIGCPVTDSTQEGKTTGLVLLHNNLIKSISTFLKKLVNIT